MALEHGKNYIIYNKNDSVSGGGPAFIIRNSDKESMFSDWMPIKYASDGKVYGCRSAFGTSSPLVSSLYSTPISGYFPDYYSNYSYLDNNKLTFSYRRSTSGIEWTVGTTAICITSWGETVGSGNRIIHFLDNSAYKLDFRYDVGSIRGYFMTYGTTNILGLPTTYPNDEWECSNLDYERILRENYLSAQIIRTSLIILRYSWETGKGEAQLSILFSYDNTYKIVNYYKMNILGMYSSGSVELHDNAASIVIS